MRFKRILLSSIVLLAGLVAIPRSIALACAPVDFESPADDIWCQVRASVTAPTISATPTPTLAAFAPVPTSAPQVSVVAIPASSAPQKSGDSPANAREVSPNLQTIPPGGRIWYKIGSNGSHMDVWMETNGQLGLGFAVYAPNQTNLQSPDTKPKGLGTYPNSDPNTLRWAGGSFTQIGTWYALVTNTSSATLTYRMGAVQSAVDKNCTSPYWEILPTGQGTYWIACK